MPGVGESKAEGGILGALRWVGAQFLRLPRPTGVLLFLVWTGVIWRLSSMEAKTEGGSFVKGWLVNSAHAPLFGFLAFLALIALPRSERLPAETPGEPALSWPRVNGAAWAWILLAVLAYGLVDEWHQSRVPTRDASPWDVLTDMTGAACTLWIASYLGQAEASRGGLTLRLMAGLALCLLAGLGAATQ